MDSNSSSKLAAKSVPTWSFPTDSSPAATEHAAPTSKAKPYTFKIPRFVAGTARPCSVGTDTTANNDPSGTSKVSVSLAPAKMPATLSPSQEAYRFRTKWTTLGSDRSKTAEMSAEIQSMDERVFALNDLKISWFPPGTPHDQTQFYSRHLGRDTNASGPLAFDACAHGRSPELIRLVLERTPDAVLAAGLRSGGLANCLHAVCLNDHADASLVEYVAQRHPAAAAQQDATSTEQGAGVERQEAAADMGFATQRPGAVREAKSARGAEPGPATSPEGDGVKTVSRGNLPLHLVLSRWSQKLVTEELLRVVLAANPAAASTPNRDGVLPIMALVSQPDSQADAILFLASQHPEALTVRHPSSGELPLHVMCRLRSPVSLPLVQHLVSLHPPSLHSTTASHDSVLHCVLRNEAGSDDISSGYDNQSENRDGNSDFIPGGLLSTVAWLLKEHPESARIAGRDGMLPLHAACTQLDISAKLFSLLLSAHGDALQARIHNGATVLHMLAQNRGVVQQLGQEQNVLDLVISLDASLLRARNKYQDTPLHLACGRNPAVTLEMVQRLAHVGRAPPSEVCENASARNESGLTPLHAVALNPAGYKPSHTKPHETTKLTPDGERLLSIMRWLSKYDDVTCARVARNQVAASRARDRDIEWPTLPAFPSLAKEHRRERERTLQHSQSSAVGAGTELGAEDRPGQHAPDASHGAGECVVKTEQVDTILAAFPALLHFECSSMGDGPAADGSADVRTCASASVGETSFGVALALPRVCTGLPRTTSGRRRTGRLREGLRTCFVYRDTSVGLFQDGIRYGSSCSNSTPRSGETDTSGDRAGGLSVVQCQCALACGHLALLSAYEDKIIRVLRGGSTGKLGMSPLTLRALSRSSLLDTVPWLLHPDRFAFTVLDDPERFGDLLTLAFVHGWLDLARWAVRGALTLLAEVPLSVDRPREKLLQYWMVGMRASAFAGLPGFLQFFADRFRTDDAGMCMTKDQSGVDSGSRGGQWAAALPEPSLRSYDPRFYYQSGSLVSQSARLSRARNAWASAIGQAGGSHSLSTVVWLMERGFDGYGPMFQEISRSHFASCAIDTGWMLGLWWFHAHGYLDEQLSGLLEYAAMTGRAPELAFLIQHIESPTKLASSLVLAATHGQTDCLRVLLASRYVLDCMTGPGMERAVLPCVFRGHLDCLRCLCDTGLVTTSLQLLLRLAVQHTRPRIAEYLLSRASAENPLVVQTEESDAMEAQGPAATFPGHLMSVPMLCRALAGKATRDQQGVTSEVRNAYDSLRALTRAMLPADLDAVLAGSVVAHDPQPPLQVTERAYSVLRSAVEEAKQHHTLQLSIGQSNTCNA